MAVVCVTCGSRLKVVDQRLIGTIANCPKCGAMVEIKPTAIESAADRAAPERPAATGPTVGEPAAERPSAEKPVAIQGGPPSATHSEPAQQLPQPPPQRPHLAVGHETGIDSEALTQSAVAFPQDLDAAYDDDAYNSPISDDADDPYSPRLTDVLAAAEAIDPAHLPADPAQVWQSEASRRVSQLGLIITLGMFGLITAAVAFVQFARSWSGPAGQVTAQASDTQPSHAGDAVGDTPGDGADRFQIATPGDAGDGALEDHGAADQRAASGVDDSAEPAGDQRGMPLTAAEPTPEPRLPQGASQPQPPANDPPQPDPIAAATSVVADGPRAAAPAPDAPSPAAPPAGHALDNLPPGLQKYVQLLNPSTADIGTPQIFDTPPTIDSIQLDAAAGEEVDDEEAASRRGAIDIPKALAMRLAIDNAGVSLAELMLLVGQLTGVPVEVELISLDLAGISTTQTLKTPAGWMSVQQWLDQTLAPAGMVAEIADERVLVYATPQKLLEKSGTALQLDDFGDVAAEVAQWVRPVVGPIGQDALEDGREEPWTFLDDEQRIDLPADRSALVRAMLAVEAARMIRGLPTRLPRWQTERWMGPWASRPAESGPAAGGPAAGAPPDARPLGPPGGDEDAPAPGQAMALTGQAITPPSQRIAIATRTAEDGARKDKDASRDRKDPDAIADWPIVAEGSSGPTLDSPRTVAGLLRQLAAENQVAIVVAWRDAMRHQLYPADLAMPFNDNLPAGAMIDELIGESGLQARDTGNGVWWIGSEAHYDRYEVISWLSIPDGGGEVAARQLAEALGADDPTALPVTWDQRTLLVRAPRYIARQLARFGR